MGNNEEEIFNQIRQVTLGRYEPNWESIDSRPLPAWFDESKVGILIHWGVFSVPSILSEWFWYQWETKTPLLVDFMKNNYRQDWTYPDFANQLTAEFFDAEEWASLLNISGAKYVVMVGKHHEGFTMWPSNYSWNWNAMDAKTMPELYELVNKYKPDIVWSDGSHAADDWYWNATTFLSWLYNDSPVKDTVVVNDRWGINVNCIHGGFLNCGDRFNPKVLQKRKWENVMTLDKYSAGYRRNAKLEDYFTMIELLTEVAQTVSCGGNILINIGITKEGTVVPIYQDILTKLGKWLTVNGEGIYSSKPWTTQNDTISNYVWYTSKVINNQPFVYAIMLEWPKNNTLILGAPKTSSTTVVSMLGYTGGNFSWKPNPAGGIQIMLPSMNVNEIPCNDVWVIKMQGVD
ncbi:FUCA [Mytilus edulis]|uniref:alpha-L-fucosidase n=1 Tax=Mytilus edulis TaxID=6550 RepID=A0A8S3QCK5_MYTED|nr:FUCA [Mytilus edulis]